MANSDLDGPLGKVPCPRCNGTGWTTPHEAARDKAATVLEATPDLPLTGQFKEAMDEAALWAKEAIRLIAASCGGQCPDEMFVDIQVLGTAFDRIAKKGGAAILTGGRDLAAPRN